MAKRTSTTYLTPGEQVAGAVLFVIYLLVLPFATGPLFRLVEALLGTQLSPALENILYYYILFAVTVIVFHGFLGRTTRVLVDRAGSAGKVLLAGLVALYGLNELVYRLTRLVVDNRTNLNDVSISAQIDDAPRVTMLIVIFLAPFVEEVLFRGLVLEACGKSVLLAYAVSCALFALVHVWQFVVQSRDLTYFFADGCSIWCRAVVLAWVYDRSGTLWTAIGLHAVTNALSVWAMG